MTALPATVVLPLAGRLANAIDDADWRDIAKSVLAQQRFDLQQAYTAGEGIERLIARHCASIDAVVQSGWARCIETGQPMSLLATGGFGRGELYPQSDIDLLVLAEPKVQRKQKPAISRLFTLLWDAGLASSHAVRSLGECVDAAREDIATLTAMMELRTLAGPDAVRCELLAALAPKKTWPPKKYFEAKLEEQRARHARYNDTADNLEPNLKEGPGGLRDLHMLNWMGMRLYGVPGLRALVPLGLLGDDECATLEREWAVLAKLRFGLHLVAPRREERLLFDHQKALASLMGLKDEDDNLAVEQMMQGFFRAAATMLRLNDRLLQRFEEQLSGAAKPVPVAAGYELRHGYLAMMAPHAITGMAEVLQLFRVWAHRDDARGLHSETARALAESLDRILPYREQPVSVRAQFVAMLSDNRAVVMLRRMARLGVLARYLPEFGKVSGRMQYDLFHVYTVDQHTLTVLGFMEGFLKGPVAGFSLPQEVVPRLRKRFLLLVAGLFHDIAKGRGGDHSQLGSEDVRVFAEAHDLPSADIELLAWLVREHLLMSVTAQRQDISDPAVVTRFATRVADREHLDYLYLLTCADIAGTSPKLWNAWKDRLLADLYTATRFALRRGLENPLNAEDIIVDTGNMALATLLDAGVDEESVQSLWATFPEEAFLRYRPEQLVWQTRGVLAQATQSSVAPGILPRATLAHPCASVASGILPRATLAHPCASVASGILPRATLAHPCASQVLVRSHGGPGTLEVFVRTPDRDGLFAALVATLDRLGLGVLDARILNSSDGHALDSFQLLAGPHTPDALRIAQTLQGALRDPSVVKPVRRAMPRQLRHFKVPVQVAFDDTADGRTRLSLVCADRPGLLADITHVLRLHRLRVHDARIATFGERVEDFFLLTDLHDRALAGQSLEPLRSALVACAEGDMAHGKPAAR